LTVLDIIEHAEADPRSDEATFLAQLRAIVAAVETPGDRLFASYCSRPARSAYCYALRD
jgi:hypothetical protein